MHGVLPMMVVGLAAAGRALADSGDPTSFSNWVSMFDSCAQPCMNDLYTNLVGDKCSSNAKSSTSESDIKCICESGDLQSTTNSAATEAGQCVVEKCGNDFDQASFAKTLTKLVNLCADAVLSSSSSSGSSSVSTATATSAAASGSTSGSSTTSGATAAATTNAASLNGMSVSLMSGSVVMLGALFNL